MTLRFQANRLVPGPCLRIRHRKLVKGSIRRELGTISFAGAKAPEIVCRYSPGQECQCRQYMPELSRINRGSGYRISNDCNCRTNTGNWPQRVPGKFVRTTVFS